ncbi:GntR family transcriptional regulator [Cesiribacter andamanensis]|uniref:Putative HTH-type transcriptional regulator ydcR n=1 Tax=Cesiribacter andamanensis AMV16 TaxID=1279009 RepID=M7N1R9_9BACT|nr:GntR family transcriptional regulator [Cesiribacter andamanensis]EMR01232.1 putative HTH-type transcriptional regulator ydcR [Cesiribacter andamanensis AMV16]
MIEFKDNQAIYLQIADQFVENILQGKWTSGDKIPSIRDTAVEFEVNPNTTLRTFNYLQEKGIIYNKRGLGYFIADDGIDKTKALKKEQFLEEELPSLFNSMQLLGISFSDLQTYYSKFNSNGHHS